ncbi:DNA-binding response regulator, NarL/FixJ family, contains REC and HTH domains [Microbacterium sp. RURRCA19A]|nr:DNA-binding response regulator, NarL/FixJ family, contains REC and HTH domains [Microbacterium sp. RURRCA19A]
MGHSEVSSLIQREEWDDLANYIEEHWVELTHSHRESLVSALNAMPAALWKSNARFAAAHEYANFIPARGAARPTRYQHAPGAEEGLLDTLARLTSQSAGARMVGRFDDAVAAAEEALRVLRQSPAAATQAIRPVLPDLRLQWAISLQLGGRLSEAVRAYERAYDEAIRHDNTRIAVEAAGTIAFDFAILGMPTQAREWLARVPVYVHDGSDTVHEMAALAAALLATHELDLDEAGRILADTPAVSSETWAMRFFAESSVESIRGSNETFATTLFALRAAHPAALSASGLNDILLRIAAAEAALQTNEPARADIVFADLAARASTLPPGVLEPLRAWRAIADDDLSAAFVIASGPLSEGTASPGVAAELRAVLAVVHLRHDQRDDAVAQYVACRKIVSDERLFDVLHRVAPDDLDRLEQLSGQPIPPAARAALASSPPRVRRPRRTAARLTPREIIVLRHLVQGRSRAEIAHAENLSQNTIKTQTTSIYRKLNVTNRDGVVRAVMASPGLLR